MFNILKQLIKGWFRFDSSYNAFELLETESGEPSFFGKTQPPPPSPKKKPEFLCSDIKQNDAKLSNDFYSDINEDLIIRRFSLCGEKDAFVAFINGMSDNKSINDFVLREAMSHTLKPTNGQSLVDYAISNIFTISDIKTESEWSKIKLAILEGQSVVFIDGETRVIIFDTRGFEKRSVSTPNNEKTVLGPKQSFIESMRTNITLIRRIVKTDDLISETRDAGGKNNVQAAILYRVGVTNKTLLKEIKRRLSKIDMRVIQSTGTIEQLINENKLFPFPLSLSTERPDRAANYLMQGHIVLLLDGSPLAHVLPITLPALMATSEDAYVSPPIGTVMRVVRWAGTFISVFVPPLFIAVATHHPGLLSNEVLYTLISSRKMVFVPMGVELLFLLLIFHLVREAGSRVPSSIGAAISIIGGLILGQAAVTANLASPVLLIVVALTGLGDFCIPDYTLQLSAIYLRLYLVVLSMLGGLLGFFTGLLVAVAVIASVKSFGVPYLSPFSPKTFSKRPFILRGFLDNIKTAVDYDNTEEK